MKRFLFLSLLLIAFSSEACFIIVGRKNGRVLVGNNEDWYQSDAKYWVERPRPGKGEKYAALFFGFKGEFKTAQGGFNEQGLFFDATAVPRLELSDSAKSGRKKAIHPIFKNILKTCATVAEAEQVLNRYYIPFIKKVQVILADATGAYLVLNVNGIAERGALLEGYRIITNFHADAKRHFCYRYDSAESRLGKQFENSLEGMATILSLSHQEFPGATVYSNVYDLTKASATIFYNHRFDRSVTATFNQPTDKTVYLEQAFPRRMIGVLLKSYKRKGAGGAIAAFRSEQKNPKTLYQCDAEQLSDLTTWLLNRSRFEDAYLVAKENAELFPESDRAHDQFGKSLMYSLRIEEAKAEYARALALNPNNRWAKSVLGQFEGSPSGNATLVLRGHEKATLVSAAGEFNEWQALQNICFKNASGQWECKLKLPAGRYAYRFVVDGRFIDDPLNPPVREVEKGFLASELQVP